MQTEDASSAGFDATVFLSGLPGLPGVYRMFNSEGEMLYVGKARDLKKRVSSYFQKGGHGPRISMMLTQVAGVEVTVTRSEGEALILESNLIKSLAPRYNILFRDDKSYPYLVLGGEQFSRLGFHRGAMDKADKYFGPFPHAGAVRESIQLLQRVFRLRTCDKSVFSNRSRPCLLHQIHRCSAPCVGLIATEQYAEDVRDAKLFLEGRSDDVVARLAARMQHASDAQRFEDAALYRDQIQSLSKVKQRQYADTGSDLDADIIGLAQDHGLVCVNLVMVRGGRHLGDRSFFPQNAQGQPSDEVLRAFIAQHYLDRPAPDVIVVGETVPEMELLLAEHTGHKVHVVAAPTGERRAGLEMARKNAAQAIRQRLLEQGAQEARLAAMRDALGLPESIKRIECFDASHTQGEATVTSCVVYDGHDMRRSDYRRYNISGVTPGDDYGAIKQALTRRYANLASGEGVAPDLIMIDGGKGQIHTARDALAEIGLSDILILGIAKGPGRKPGLEELWLGDAAESITLPPEHPGLHLLQSIRDEAHRFAITGHRARRAKRRVTSTLEGISGIGAKRRRQLLTHFGGIKGIMGASVEDLAQVEGISLKLADKLYQVLHAS